MGIDNIIMSDLNIRSVKLNHDAPNRFVEPSVGRAVSLWYVFYRLIAAFYMCVSLATALFLYLFDMPDYRYFLHFPVWGYMIMTLYSILLAVQVCIAHRRMRLTVKVTPAIPQRKVAGYKRRQREKAEKKEAEVKPSLSIVIKFIWIMHYISLYSGVVTLVMYYTNLFKGVIRDSFPNPPSFSIEEIIMHIAFGPVSFLDFWISGVTIRFMHVYMMPCYSIVYHLTLFGYTMATATEKYPPLYEVADYPSMARITISIIYFVGFALIVPVAIHFLYYLLNVLKLYLAEKIMNRLQPYIDASQQADATQGAASAPVAVDPNAAAAAAAAAAAEAAEKEGAGGPKTTIPPIIESDELSADIIVDHKVFT